MPCVIVHEQKAPPNGLFVLLGWVWHVVESFRSVEPVVSKCRTAPFGGINVNKRESGKPECWSQHFDRVSSRLRSVMGVTPYQVWTAVTSSAMRVPVYTLYTAPQ